MRTASPESRKAFWLARFLRLVLTHRPQLRFRLDHTRIDQLYASCPDAILAARTYLGETK